MVVDLTTLLPVVSGALSKNPSENREALVDVVVSCGTSEGRKKTPSKMARKIRDGGTKGSREILHKVAYVTVLSNPWQTALICSVESFTSFRPKRNAPRDHEANRNWLRDIPRECENRRDGTDLAKRTKTSENGSNGSNGSHREFTKILSIIRKHSNSHHQANHGDQSCFHFPRLGHDKATVRVKRIVSSGLALDYTQMRSMHRFMVEMFPAELRHEANLKSGITRSHRAKYYIQRINNFLNSQERRSLRYLKAMKIGPGHERSIKRSIKCGTREYCPVQRQRCRKETGFHNREHKSVLEHLFPNKKWLSTQHIYRSIVRGLRPFANAASVDVAKMNDPPFFKKDPQRGPGFTEKETRIKRNIPSEETIINSPRENYKIT
ncbi:hypothetical protein G5I_10315 [Acromyrmex echinatior]|uniref:Uncharacterized protein n=1 Tax=Acromyrmex echinatior TaxID=103372 RepID=F4WWK1_ACREC|nr:hypothetical protein G5I_10315 [Acromyrmex echinatior]